MDTSVIRGGDNWPADITRALKRATVIIAIIGPEWLRAQDKYSKRRIDDPNDWVRKELEYGLQRKLPIIPVLVMNAGLPDPEGLPVSLKSLPDHQAFVFREDEWENDLGRLLSRIEDFGFELATPRVQYPIPTKRVDELTEGELTRILRRLSNWKLSTNRLSPKGKKKVELMRVFEFASFEDAIHFMTTATRHISLVDHHPDWENIWRTITVWLTTWDLEHKPSIYDVELAEYLDQLYLNYEAKERPGREPSAKRPRRQSRN